MGHRILLSGLLLLVCFRSASALTDEELFRNFQLSFVNPGARSTGMGNAFIALADDATAAEANPAGLTILNKFEVSLEYRRFTFDPDKLNSLNNFSIPGASIETLSQNALAPLNTAAFLSLVYPGKSFTFAFSRQEAVRLQGSIKETFFNFQQGEVGATINVDVDGLEDLAVRNWNFSGAKKIGHDLSLGATLRYSTLDWQTSNVNSLTLIIPPNEPVHIDAFQTSLSDQAGAFAFSGGFIYRIKPFLSVGAVYKRNARFHVTETEAGDLAQKPGSVQNVLKIPDTFGIGVSLKPNDIITVNADLVRIEFSQLLDGFQAGYNFATGRYGNDQIHFQTHNRYEFRFGAEYIVVVRNFPLALRAGYYRKPSNAIAWRSGPESGTEFEKIRAMALFPEGNSEDHATIGTGIVLSSNIQIDVAFDSGKASSQFVVSTVARF